VSHSGDQAQLFSEFDDLPLLLLYRKRLPVDRLFVATRQDEQLRLDDARLSCSALFC
jgi:hypothetical protein